MMTIDLNTGEFTYKEWTFSPVKNKDDIKSEFSQNEFELRLKNDKWETYKLNISGTYILRIIFFDKNVWLIEIFPHDTNEDNEKMLYSVLTTLGGEHSYTWGKIELNNDLKAGYKSVIIKYN